MSIKKQYLKKSGKCKCTFRLPKEAAPEANKVTIVGDFNEWDDSATPMKRLKSGEFKAELTLDAGRSYEYKFLIDEETWENDWEADAYIPKPDLATDNSLVNV